MSDSEKMDAYAQILTEHNPEQREVSVRSEEPRIHPLDVEELTDDLMQIVIRMIQVNAALDSREREALTDLVPDQAVNLSASELANQLANLPEIIRTMLRHPALFARQTDIGIQLLGQGTLSARDRELAILRIGWLCQAPYEWGEHTHIAKKARITSAEIERITQGSDAPGWNEHEQAILCAVEELHKNAMISDTTWSVLSKSLNDKQLIELPVVIGQYQTVAYYQNSLRLRLHDGNAGLQAR